MGDDDDFKREDEKLEKAARDKEDAIASGETTTDNLTGDMGAFSADSGSDDYQSIPIPPFSESATPLDSTPKTSPKLRKSSSFNKSSNTSASNSAQNSPTELSPKTANAKKLAPINSSNKSNVKSTKKSSKESNNSNSNEVSKLGLYS